MLGWRGMEGDGGAVMEGVLGKGVVVVEHPMGLIAPSSLATGLYVGSVMEVSKGGKAEKSTKQHNPLQGELSNSSIWSKSTSLSQQQMW